MAFKDFKFTQRIRFINAETADLDNFEQYDFEIQNARVTFQENVRNTELIDGTLQQFVLWYRLVVQFSSPYLRRSGTGSFDFNDVIEAFNDPERTVFVSLPDVGMDYYAVIKQNDSFSATVTEHFINSDWAFTVSSRDTLSELPDWFKQTRNSPKYML